MESRYQDEALRGLDPVDQLVQISRWVGAETSLAVWGGETPRSSSRSRISSAAPSASFA